MKSIKSVYKIGYGPSSSHTMGPSFAAADFMTKYPEADFIKVILYGSLAKTGKGHGTDRAIIDTLSDIKNEVNFNTSTPTDVHPNTVDFIAFKNARYSILFTVFGMTYEVVSLACGYLIKVFVSFVNNTPSTEIK